MYFLQDKNNNLHILKIVGDLMHLNIPKIKP